MYIRINCDIQLHERITYMFRIFISRPVDLGIASLGCGGVVINLQSVVANSYRNFAFVNLCAEMKLEPRHVGESLEEVVPKKTPGKVSTS
jgi:hypothetical protein